MNEQGSEFLFYDTLVQRGSQSREGTLRTGRGPGGVEIPKAGNGKVIAMERTI